MAKHRIAWLPGDGIGRRCATPRAWCWTPPGFDAEYLPGDIGWEFWRREGDALPARTLDLLRNTDCAFFGAITSKPAGRGAAANWRPNCKGEGLTYRSPIVRMRQMLDLYICLRPCRAFPGNPLNYREDIDLVVFRENTEGMYIGVEFPQRPGELPRRAGHGAHPAGRGHLHPQRHAPRHRGASWKRPSSTPSKNGRRKVTAVHKANVLRATCGVFLEAAQEVAARYPQIEFDTANVDAMCMWLLKNPQNYDVIVTTNLFGDILSDLCAQLVGGMGFALQRQHRRADTRCSSPRTARRRSTPGRTRSIRWRPSWRPR